MSTKSRISIQFPDVDLEKIKPFPPPLKEIINSEIIVDFLLDSSPISISQTELLQLNDSLNNLYQNSIKLEDLENLDTFSKKLGSLNEVNPKLMKLAIVLSTLSEYDEKQIFDILTKINLNVSENKDQNLRTIRSKIRPRLQSIVRDYPKRIPQKGPAPSTITFGQAIVEGYTIDQEQYKEDLSRLLDFHQVPNNYLNYLVRLLENYPDIYSIIHQFRVIDNNLAQNIIEVYYDIKPNWVQVLYGFAINYPLIIKEDQIKINRRNQLEKLSNSYLEALYDIYGTLSLNKILNSPQHPLESYLIAINQTETSQLKNLVRGFGMLIPEQLTNREIRTYILRHISEYRKVITRPQNLLPISNLKLSRIESLRELISALISYTDLEIMEYFGYVGGFDNRNSLLDLIFETIDKGGFMLFNKLHSERTINVETSLLTPLSDLPTPYLAFGAPFEFRIIDLDELNLAFVNKEGQKIFSRVENEKLQYSIPQLERLQIILVSMKFSNPQLSESIDQLLEHIQIGLASNMKKSPEVNKFIRITLTQTKEVQEYVKEIFYKLFYAGMYLRGWDGPGTRYPESNHQSQVSPNPKFILTISEVLNLLKQIEPISNLFSTIKNIREIDLRNGVLFFSIEKLFDTIDQAILGNYCDRNFNRGLILSANYYLGVVFKEIIPDFDPDRFDLIY